MKTLTLKAHVYARREFDGQPKFTVFGFKTDDAGHIGQWIGEQDFKFTLPPDFSLTAVEIAALEAELARAAQEFRATQKRINDRLAKLQAITNEVTS